MIAYKFPTTGKWTIVESIYTTVGYSGSNNSIANIKPVTINGSTISKVTLHNNNFIKSKLIDVGSEVYVVKANEVVPEIIDVKNSISTTGYNLSITCPCLLVK